MMSRAKRPIRKPAAHRNNYYVCVVIAHVIAHLLQAPQNRKICNRIRKYDLSAQGHACRDAGHILLGDARVEEAIGKSPSERFDHSKSEVSHNQADSLVLFGQSRERMKEGASHSPSPNSAKALAISSRSGAR